MSDGAFQDRFRLLSGYAPYSWQIRLYARLRHPKPDAPPTPVAIDLPTGLGKTSVIAIWLLALADGALLPRRLIYVVDRRAVVDQATVEAEKIASAIAPGATGLLGDIRTGLRLPPAAALPVSTLRGQFLDNRRWMDSPQSPAIVVGTVDMVGSRLGFGGYGVTRRMRPVHAGLLGVDSLLVLDEAHLVPSFEAFARRVAKMTAVDANRGAAGDVIRPLQVMSLSATGRRSTGEVFPLIEEDRADAGVAGRLNAVKQLRLTPPASLKEKQALRRLTDEAWRLGEGGARVLVFTNSRSLAQDVAKALGDRAKKKDAYGKDADLVALLVGERRVRERAALTESVVFRAFLSSGNPDPQGRPLFLVATSAGEVGVDLDADHLVCDLVAWERMIQRFGRVNRRASDHVARISVIPIPFKDGDGEDVVADEQLALYARVFQEEAWPSDDGAWDVSPGRLFKLKEQAERSPALKATFDAATTPTPLHPLLTRAIVDAWSLTSIEGHTGETKIEPWLRGWAKPEPQTAVIWRRFFPLHQGEASVTKDLKDFFEAAPPHVTETLEAPSWRVASWLQDRAKALTKPKKGVQATDDRIDSSQDESVDASPVADFIPEHSSVVVVLTPDRSVEAVHDLRRLVVMSGEILTRQLSYGTVIVDARIGGLDENGLLDAKSARLPSTLDSDEWASTAAAAEDLHRAAGLRIRFAEAAKTETIPGVGAWRVGHVWRPSDVDASPAIWVEQWRGQRGREPGDPAIADRPQRLHGPDGHLEHTGRAAEAIVRAIGLPTPVARGVTLAARAHDLGKARDLWQDAMSADRSADRPFAKTRGGGNGAALNGYRHEFGSVLDLLAPRPREGADASVHAEIQALPQEERDLVLHLIAAHHGHARPTIKAYDPDSQGEPPSRSAAHAREIVLRFARLQSVWGPWGLAWLEALLRAADWSASRDLNEGEDVGPAANDPHAETARG